MQKKVTTISNEEMEDFAFTIAMKESEESGNGSLTNVKSHLSKVATK